MLSILLLGTIGAYQTWSKARDRAQTAEERYLNTLKRHEQINAALGRVETEEGLEEELRSRFNVAKEGEGVVVILDSSRGGQNSEERKQDGSWWKEIILFWR